MSGGWQHMVTAPHNGTRIVGWFADRAIIVFWREGPEYIRKRQTGNRTWYWSDGYSRYREPDCWQPEPSPPDAAEFPAKAPPPTPRGPTTVVVSPAARRRIVEVKRTPVLVERPRAKATIQNQRIWCAQCEQTVMKPCASPFCKAMRAA